MIIIFPSCKNAQTTLTCSVVTFACLVAISSHLSHELNRTSYHSLSSLTRRLISWKLAPVLGLIRRSGSSLVFSTSSFRLSCCKRLQGGITVALSKYSSAFRIFIAKLLSSFFRDFHRKSTGFHEPQSGLLWTRNLYLPLDPDESNKKGNFEGIVLLSKATKLRSLAEVQFVTN